MSVDVKTNADGTVDVSFAAPHTALRMCVERELERLLACGQSVTGVRFHETSTGDPIRAECMSGESVLSTVWPDGLVLVAGRLRTLSLAGEVKL